MKSSNTNTNLHFLRLFLIISLSIISIRTDESSEHKMPTIDASNSGVISLTPENITEETQKYNYGFVMFTSDDCKHSQAMEPLFHEASHKLGVLLENKEKKELNDAQQRNRVNLSSVGWFMVNSKTYPELMEKYGVTSTPHYIWFNNLKDHYQIYTGETELPKYFFNFALQQIEYNIEETTLKRLLKLPEEKELNGENLILFIGNEKGKNSFYFTHIMQCAFNHGVENLYTSNDEEIRRHFDIRFKNDKNNFDAILFKIRNKKLDLNQYERLNMSSFDFMEIDQAGKNALTHENYSNKFDLAKAKPIKKIDEMIQLYAQHPVTVFSHKMEKLITRGIPTIVMIHDYDMESAEYKNMLTLFSEVARAYRRELFFMISTKYSKLTQLFAESFSLEKKQFPALCLTSTHSTKSEQKSIDKYLLLNKGEELTLEKIVNFIEDWKNMKLKVFIPSEDIPTENPDEDGIYKFVAKNYSKTLNNNKKFILINICSDRLEVCEKFRKRLARIAHKLKNSDRVIVAEFNPYLNEIEEMYDATTIPSVFLIPDRGDRVKDMKKFTGRLSTRELVKWVIDETGLEIEDNKLPLEDTLNMEEDLSDLKALDLENKGTSRQIMNKLMDPVQKELWKFPPQEDIELENNYYADFYEKFFDTKVVKELKSNNDEL